MMTITPKIRLKDAFFYKKVLPWLTLSSCLLILIGTILLIVGSGFNAGLQAAINSAEKDADKIPTPSSFLIILSTTTTTTEMPSVADHIRVSMLNSFGSTFTAIGGFALFVCLYFYVTCYLYRYEAYAEYDAELYDELEKCKELDVAGETDLTAVKKRIYGTNKSETSANESISAPSVASTNNIEPKKYSISKCLDCKITEELGFSISESHSDMTAVWFAEKINNANRYESLLTKIGIKASENLVAVHAYPYEDTVWLTIVDFNKPENNQIIQLTDFQKLKNPLEHKHTFSEMIANSINKHEEKKQKEKEKLEQEESNN